MKKFLFLSIAAIACVCTQALFNPARAQISRQITIAAADDTLVNTDTAYVTLTFDASFKSVECWSKLAAGAHTGGRIVFQGEYPHGSTWAGLDSLSITDTSYAQFKLFTVPSPRLHKSYRLAFYKSGTGSAEIKAYYIRYTGGAILRPDPTRGLAFFDQQRRDEDYFIRSLSFSALMVLPNDRLRSNRTIFRKSA